MKRKYLRQPVFWLASAWMQAADLVHFQDRRGRQSICNTCHARILHAGKTLSMVQHICPLERVARKPLELAKEMPPCSHSRWQCRRGDWNAAAGLLPRQGYCATVHSGSWSTAKAWELLLCTAADGLSQATVMHRTTTGHCDAQDFHRPLWRKGLPQATSHIPQATALSC